MGFNAGPVLPRLARWRHVLTVQGKSFQGETSGAPIHSHPGPLGIVMLYTTVLQTTAPGRQVLSVPDTTKICAHKKLPHGAAA